MNEKVKKIIKESLLFRPLYYLYDYYRNIRKWVCQKQWLRRASKRIIQLQQLLQNSNVFFFFDMGTLLGIIREGKILSHDKDIDIGVKVNSESERQIFVKYLLDNRCTLQKTCYSKETGVFAQSFILEGIKFDIGYYFTEDYKDICYLIVPASEKIYDNNERALVQLNCSKILGIEKHNFLNHELNCPQNSEKYLSERYGLNWRIPDKKYKYWTGPSTSSCKYHGFVKTE